MSPRHFSIPDSNKIYKIFATRLPARSSPRGDLVRLGTGKEAPITAATIDVHVELDDVYLEFFAVVESLEYVVVSLREWVSQVVATGYQHDPYRSHFSSSVRGPLTRYFLALVPSSTARPVSSYMATVSQLPQLGGGASRIA